MYQNYDESGEYDYEGEANRIKALELKWTLGFNFENIDCVHNLTNGDKKEIFYVVGHTGVIYDYKNNTQKLLQGHCNKIMCSAYYRSIDGKNDIIVTADVGPDSMLVVWDAQTGTPRKTIFDPNVHGTQFLDISPNGEYIATISMEPNFRIENQVITLWKWDDDQPSKITQTCDFYDKKGEKFKFPQTAYINYIKFNPDNHYELVTTSKEQVIFWNWESSGKEFEHKGFEYYVPTKNWQAHLTQTVFIPNTCSAVTGTVDGFIIVWDISLILEDYTQPEERRQIKRVNLMSNQKKSENGKKEPVSINILKIQGDNLVIGSSNGCIRFYDFYFRIKAWFEDIEIGSITSISFASDNLEESSQIKDTYQQNGQDETEIPFKCPDFIVVDKEAKVTVLNYELFERIEKDSKKGEVILKQIVSPIVNISVRPKSTLLAIVCQNGDLFEWDFEQKSHNLTSIKTFQDYPKCIDYSPIYVEKEKKDGIEKKIEKGFLAVATGRRDGNVKNPQAIQNSPSGKVHIMHYDLNGNKNQWQNAVLDITQNDSNKPVVEQQVFSSNGKYLACMDSDYGVTLFCYDHKTWDPSNEKEWQYVGKHRVHHAKLTSISFAECIDKVTEQKYYKLFSIAEDMKLCEYNIIEIDYSDSKANFVERLQLVSMYPIEQESIPTACCQYPINMYKEDVLLTVNDQYKIKLWKCVDKYEKTCKKTVLGPTYGGAIEKLLVLNQNDIQNDYQDKYLAYATNSKVVGIIKLPLEGNPNQTMGLIAHADKITGITSTYDGTQFFTSGSDDYAVNIWNVNFKVLEEEVFYTNPNEDPYPALLEGGEDGQTHQDLKDFFYYSQIRSKDEDSTKARKLDGLVPLIAIPDMMRSMGYYPTLKEIENMQKEVEQSKYLETGQLVTELDLKMFLKLFVNHRPVYGISKQQVAEAIEILAEGSENKNALTDKEFQDILMNEGEKISPDEWQQINKILMGDDNYLPELVNAENLTNDILGFEDQDDDAEDQIDEEEYEDEEDQDEDDV